MKIAVTGALGLIGSSLTLTLEREGSVEVIGLDIRYKQNHRGYLDINDKHKLQQQIQDCDGVIHLAAISRVAWGEKNKDLCNSVNVEGTSNIVEACLLSQKQPWVIFASSREVYGAQNSLPVTENFKLNPLNTYAQTKLIGENLIAKARQNGLKAAIIRLANVYGGVFDHKDRVVPSFCLNALRNQDLRVHGEGTILDFVFIKDVIEAIRIIIPFLNTQKLTFLPIFNISTSEVISLPKLAELIIDLTNSSSSTVLLPHHSFMVDRFCGDNSLAYRLLGWKPKVSLNDGIKRFLDNLQNRTKEGIDINSIYMEMKRDENFKSYSWLPAEI